MRPIFKKIIPNYFLPYLEEKRRQQICSKNYKNSIPGDYYSMDCFDYYKCIFVHIPKAAGISVSKSLFGNLAGAHNNIKRYEKYYAKPTFKNYYKFTIVRNPYERIFSAYNFLKKGGINKMDQEFSKQHLSSINSFEDFILNWLNPVTMNLVVHFKPQIYFLENSNGEIEIDFIGRMENLKNDFDIICKRLGINRTLVHLNKNNKGKININRLNSTDQGMAVKDKIFELYKKDFELLGYKK